MTASSDNPNTFFLPAGRAERHKTLIAAIRSLQRHAMTTLDAHRITRALDEVHASSQGYLHRRPNFSLRLDALRLLRDPRMVEHFFQGSRNDSAAFAAASRTDVLVDMKQWPDSADKDLVSELERHAENSLPEVP